MLPYDTKWEYPVEKLKLGSELGSGAFGRVVRAEMEVDEDYRVEESSGFVLSRSISIRTSKNPKRTKVRIIQTDRDLLRFIQT